ncbi:MAG: sensor histidine kinase [Halarcobacter ebronensis]
MELSKYILERDNINLRLIVEKDLKIYGFYNELSHVFLNIISNSKDALKNLKKDRYIKIIIKEHKGHARINIYDNGEGIDENILPQIFEPYYTTKYKSAGTGIGLYMSKQIIERHMNGNIKCKNVFNKIDGYNLEHGALFIIDIPIDKQIEGTN